MIETYILDWLQLIFRWLHLITGIAWIGASFYFIWLDNNLEKPPRWKIDKGIKGDLWAIHGGGIYEIAKYQLAPEKMPDVLHWFKWEAYSTWLTGMVLMILVFYVGAEAYLIDSRIAELTQWQAIGISIISLISGWVLYEILCSSAFASNGYLVTLILGLLLATMSFTLSQIFSGRGAYIHVGAIMGTIMAGNVFRVIIPSQRALVNAIEIGEYPDPSWGTKAKLRSTHNNYLTLPLLFIMISNHYPMTYTHQYNWLVLLAIIGITVFSRHYFNLRHRGSNQPSILIISVLATVILAWLILPDSTETLNKPTRLVSDETVKSIIMKHCANCHAAKPSDEMFAAAPGGIELETLDQIKRWSSQIKAVSVNSENMPLLNKTGMTAQERQIVGQWIDTYQID